MSWGGGVSPCADGQKVTVHKDKNPLHKHFAEMPIVGGGGSKIVEICRRLKWMFTNGIRKSTEMAINTYNVL